MHIRMYYTPLLLPDTCCCLLESKLNGKLGFPKLVLGRVFNLELLKSAGELRLDLLLGTALELHADLGARDRALDLVDVSFKVTLRLMTRAEVLVCLLELLGILDHLLDLERRETANGVLNA